MSCSAYSKKSEVLEWMKQANEDQEEWMSLHPLYRAYLTIAPLFIILTLVGVFAYIFLA